LLVFAAALEVTACAAQRAQGPLTVALGLSPAATAAAVHDFDFCRLVEADAGDQHDRETFSQCGRPGVVFGDAWIVARYQDQRTVALQRFERWVDRERAVARWNQLVERRATSGPASQSARDLVFARQGIPDGTEAWVAFERRDELVAVYLLTTHSASDPAILEEILLRTPPAPPPERNPSR
jgi:hypothetical protein